MVDVAKYQCRCGDMVNVMLPKCPRCDSPRFDPPPVPQKFTVTYDGVVIGEVEVVLKDLPDCCSFGKRRKRKRKK